MKNLETDQVMKLYNYYQQQLHLLVVNYYYEQCHCRLPLPPAPPPAAGAATATGLDRERIEGKHFDWCIMDEASQCSEPAAWIILFNQPIRVDGIACWIIRRL